MQDLGPRFVDFLLRTGALRFGEFTTKSGRPTPYFINTAVFDDGPTVSRLGDFYAEHILSLGLRPDIVFGPAYKGIPLCVATACALGRQGHLAAYTFNRKEAKDHGDKGLLVGRLPKDGDRVVIVEDVITAGTTLRETVPLLRSLGRLELLGVVIAVDRREKGENGRPAADEIRDTFGLPVLPLVTIHDILTHLRPTLPADLLGRIDDYLRRYGA